MSHKTGRKLGFIMALSMLVGSVVGIGIFFKSHGILRSNDWNGIGTLMAWILGGILSITAAVSFSEIGSMKTGRTSGIAAWAEKVGGKKIGYFVRFNYSFFYMGLLAAVLGVFGSEMFVKMIIVLKPGAFAYSTFPVYAHVLVGLVITLSFLSLNFFSLRTGGYVQTITTALKWVPLLIVAFAGIGLATTNHEPKGNFGTNAFTNGNSFTFTGMLAALPAVLFAFDAFLNVGSMSHKMKKPEKLPLVVLVGMFSILGLYLLIAVSAILHGTGMVDGTAMGASFIGIFGQIFEGDTREAMSKFTMVFMVVSTFGVVNGMSAAAVHVHSQAIETNTIFMSKKAVKKFGLNKSIFGYMMLITFMWTLSFGIPASILNSDSIIDGVSNFPTLFFFGIYGLIIALYTLKRKEMDTRKMNNILFKIVSLTAIIGIVFVVGYQVFYGFSIASLHDMQGTSHWGLFAGDLGGSGYFPSTTQLDFGVQMSKLQTLFVFFAFLFFFFYFPKLNRIATNSFEDNDVYIDTFKVAPVAKTTATKKA